MSIHIFEITEADKVYLKERLPNEEVFFYEEPLTGVEQTKSITNTDIISVFVNSRIGADIIDALPQLKLIATRSTGYDHINVPAAESRGIIVSNVPTYGENTVAEHTFALMLSLSRNLHLAYTRTSSGDFTLGGLQGFDLKGKTLGVIGTGHIGMHVIRIANGFGMNVVAYDMYQNTNAAEVLGFEYTSLKDLMNRSDIVTLHAPLNNHTHHMIGEHNINDFKRGAILINTARGGLIDTSALLKALDEGILRGAGLDVIEGEEIFSEEKQLLLQPDISQERLKMALRNMTLIRRTDLIITPHLAFDSREAIERILNTTVANIKAFKNNSPQNIVHL